MSRVRVLWSPWSGRLALLLLGGSLLVGLATPVVGAVSGRGAACLDCHDKVVPGFNASFHAKIWGDDNDCDVCHGDTTKHIADPAKETIVSFSKAGKRSAAELTEPCLGCHTGAATLTGWETGIHQKNDVPCTACHAIHQPRATVKQTEVCFACHRDIRSDANKLSHHPMLEGKIKCSDCHVVHGTEAPHLLAAESTNQLCYQCHADKRGPFAWQHPPVEEDCLICHTPHGSRHQTLLVEKVVTLCQNCHDASSPAHAAVAYNADYGFAGSKSPQDKLRFVGRACLECHHAIHGSANFRRSPLSR